MSATWRAGLSAAWAPTEHASVCVCLSQTCLFVVPVDNCRHFLDTTLGRLAVYCHLQTCHQFLCFAEFPLAGEGSGELRNERPDEPARLFLCHHPTWRGRGGFSRIGGLLGPKLTKSISRPCARKPPCRVQVPVAAISVSYLKFGSKAGSTWDCTGKLVLLVRAKTGQANVVGERSTRTTSCTNADKPCETTK